MLIAIHMNESTMKEGTGKVKKKLEFLKVFKKIFKENLKVENTTPAQNIA